MRKLTAGPVAVGCFATIVLFGGVEAAKASDEPPPPTICLTFSPSTTAPAFNTPQNCIGVPADFTDQFDNIRERNRSRLDSWNWIRWLIKPAIGLVVVLVIGARKLIGRGRSSGTAAPRAPSPPPPPTPGPPPPPPFGQSPLDSPPSPPPPPSTSDVLSSWGVDPAPPETPTPRGPAKDWRG